MIFLNWRDNRLEWDDSYYDEGAIDFPIKRIWTPEILLVNPLMDSNTFKAVDPTMKGSIVINYDGNTGFYLLQNFKTICDTNLFF